MKLRQKLAVALASAMVLTSVPVVTMAASTNTLTRETVMVSENWELKNSSTAPALKINLDDYSGEKETFYLKLDNAEWNKHATEDKLVDGDGTWSTYTENGVTVTISNITKTELKVTVEGTFVAQPGSNAKAPVVRIPLLTKGTEGEAAVEIVTMGSSSTVSKDKFVFATTSDKVATVKVETEEMPSLYTGGKIADIIITEAVTESLKATDKNTIELEIQNNDFEFAGTTFTAKGTYGFGSHTSQELVDAGLKAEFVNNDKQVLRITLPAGLDADSLGQIVISDLQVKATTKTPETGDLTIDIAGKAVDEQNDVKVADIVEYGSKITVKDDKVLDIVAGHSKELTFTLAETEKTSFINNREVEFTFDKGYLAAEGEDFEANKAAVEDVVTVTANDTAKTELAIKDVVIEDEKIVGFVVDMLADNNLNKLTVEATLSLGLEEEGEITVTATGRSLEKEASAVVANAKKSIEVKAEEAVLKVGLKGQEAGKITITEAEKAMLKSGGKLEITVPVENGITVKEAPEVTVVDGDIQFGKVEVSDVDTTAKTVKITVPVKRASKTASTFEISNITFDTDRTVAEGTFDVKVGGDAITSVDETMELADFIVIGTANTEDLVGANGLAKGTSKFVIGESKYTVNGVEKTMDAQSFIQDPGFTMVPMRYVAEAFGVEGNNILFSKGVTTIFAGSRTIQLTNGSNVAIVNGVQVKMATKVMIKEGRTYAPIGEVAQLLGVSKSWDNTTKTATFTNK